MIRTKWLLLLSMTLATVSARAETGTVRVVGPDGKPVPNAEVFYQLNYGGRATSLAASADAVGRADLELTRIRLQRGFYRGTVAAIAPGFGVGLASFGKGEKLEGEAVVHLEAAHSLSGAVVDEKGAPVAGATVAVTYIDTAQTNEIIYQLQGDVVTGDTSPLAARFRTVTDASGRYTFTGLPESCIAGIRLDDPRFASATVPGDCFLAEAPPLTAKPGASLQGRVLQDGAPAAGIRVIAMLIEGWDNDAATVTDKDGHYHLTGLQPSAYRVMTAPPDELQRVSTGVKATASQTAVVPDLKLEPGGTVEGTVRDAVTGAGIADVSLMYRGQNRVTGRLPEIVTDAGGHYRFRVAPGDARVIVDIAPGHARGDGKRLKVAAGEAATADISLPAAATLEGVVRDEAGKPVTGVPIRASYWWGEDTSGPDGRFFIGGLTPGEVTLTSIGLWQIVSSKKLTVPADTVITVRERAETPLRGRVVDTTGAPVAGVSVSLFRALADEAYERVKLTTDADGYYETVARSGDTASATIFKTGWRVKQQPVITTNLETIGLDGAPHPNPQAKFTVGDGVVEKR